MVLKNNDVIDPNKPLISIVVPVYKVENYLHRCVESILKQTYENLEIILVDDGSPDHSPVICDKFANLDNRIKVIHKENGGVSSAWNAGLKICKGDYIGFVDSDDWIREKMYEKLLNMIISYKADIAMCNAFSNDNTNFNEKEYKRKILSRDEFMPLILKDAIGSQLWKKLYSRHLLENIYFKEGKTTQDMQVSHLIFSRANKLAWTEEPLYYYYESRPDNISNHSAGKFRGSMYRALANIDRYNFANKEYPECKDEVLDKAVSFSLGAFALSKTEDRKNYSEDLRTIGEFLKGQRKEILKSKEINLWRKLVLNIVLVSPRSYSWLNRKAKTLVGIGK